MNMRALVFLILFSSALSAVQWDCSSPQDAAAISRQIQYGFQVKELSFQSDVSFSKEELVYLCDFKEGDLISGTEIARAVEYLFQKKLFEKITVHVEGNEQEKKIFFQLRGLWRFEKLKVSGVWVGKDWYKKYYLLEPGQQFDREQHYHSMMKIKQACKRDGYFNVSTSSDFSYNRKTKGVVVQAEINRDRRFVIRKNSLRIYADKRVGEPEKKRVEKKLLRMIERALSHTKYAKKNFELLAKEIKHELALLGYLHVSIDLHEHIYSKRHAVHLEWHINIRKKRDFIFFGNHFFSSNQLLEQMLQFGRSAWIVPASILSQEIRNAYKRKGFWQIEIEAKDEDNRSFFVIREGKRATIDAIRFEGVRSFSHRALNKKFFAKLKRHYVFEQALLDRALERLTDFYHKAGFLEMRIEGQTFQPLEGLAHELVIRINEGEQTVVDEMQIIDHEKLLAQSPLGSKLFGNMPMLYDDVRIQEQKQWLAALFRKQGYLMPRVESRIVKQEDKTKLLFTIQLGEKSQFGKTIVNGAIDVPYKNIVRELAYKRGEAWDQDKLRQSFVRLKNAHLFDAISLVPLLSQEESNERDVLLRLHKDDPFELRIRGGVEFQHIRQYQTFAGVAYKVGGTFMVKNPSNHGDHFRFDADVARSHREVRLKYAYPWLFGMPLDGVAQTYATKYEQPGFIGSKKNLYTFYQHGFLTGVRHKNRYLDGGLNVGFEVLRTTFSDDDLETRAAAIRLARAINFDVRLLDQNVPYFFFEPTIMVDLLDDNLYPRKGMFTVASLKGMFPTKSQFSNSYFLKLLVEHSWFVPLKQVVAAFRFRFGHIFHRNFSDIMPSERFYLGGSNSVRSYEADLAPPTSIFVDDDGKKHIVPRGGKTMLNVNGELRIPIAPKASFVLFQDLGLLGGDSLADFTAQRLVAGTGFGMRYHTPIGPLRFDIGWKWRKERPEERSFNWVLTFGQAF